VPDASRLDVVPEEVRSRCTFPPPGSPFTCAVSGGADSLALLVLASDASCDVTAVHVDHGLRPGSASEAAVVADAAERLGAGFRSVQVHVEPGPNLEARAREARYRALPVDVATGHTADDQVETILINLIRGAGIDGLAGMRPGPEHPILGVRRFEARELCRGLGLDPIVDPTNADPVHRRNRVRHEIVPLLCEVAGRDVVPLIARQAGLLRDEADLLECLAAALDPTDSAALCRAPRPLARRAVRRWLHRGRSHPPDLAAVDRVLDVAAERARATDVGERRRVRRSRGVLHLEDEMSRRQGGRE
jgi:tRNA(Ile)-lysidine synthase